MTFQRLMLLVSGILTIAGMVPYIAAILRRQTKPAKASWLIWAVLDTITFAGMFAEESVNGQIIGAALGSWIIFLLALKRGTHGWTTLDKCCLGGGAIGIALWALFNSPTIGIVVSLIVVFVGSIPTFVSAWADPSRENFLAWILFLGSCVTALLAVPVWDLANAAQPVVFTAVSAIMMYILISRKGDANGKRRSNA